MTEDAHMRLDIVQPFARLIRELSPFIQNVPDSDGHSGATDHTHAREPALFKLVDIAGDGDHRSNPLQLTDHTEVADITGVQDGCDARKVLDEGRVEEAMRIGDHTDTDLPPGFHGVATG